jgi:hypothetical protein
MDTATPKMSTAQARSILDEMHFHSRRMDATCASLVKQSCILTPGKMLRAVLDKENSAPNICGTQSKDIPGSVRKSSTSVREMVALQEQSVKAGVFCESSSGQETTPSVPVQLSQPPPKVPAPAVKRELTKSTRKPLGTMALANTNSAANLLSPSHLGQPKKTFKYVPDSSTSIVRTLDGGTTGSLDGLRATPKVERHLSTPNKAVCSSSVKIPGKNIEGHITEYTEICFFIDWSAGIPGTPRSSYAELELHAANALCQKMLLEEKLARLENAYDQLCSHHEQMSAEFKECKRSLDQSSNQQRTLERQILEVGQGIACFNSFSQQCSCSIHSIVVQEAAESTGPKPSAPKARNL